MNRCVSCGDSKRGSERVCWLRRGRLYYGLGCMACGSVIPSPPSLDEVAEMDAYQEGICGRLIIIELRERGVS
jgi:hypothetical protein